MTASTLFDIVKFFTQTQGAGPLAVGVAIPGFLTPSQAGAVSGDVVSYGLFDGSNSEVGQGTLTQAGSSWSLSRDTVSQSTNGGAHIFLSGNNVQVALTIRAEDVTGGTGGISTAGFTAVGNTTGQSSSITNSLSAFAFSGAGGVSVGFSGSSIVISGAAAGAAATAGLTAIGNTAGGTSSTTGSLSTIQLSGAGGASVGFTNGTWIVSGATTQAQSNQTAGVTALGNTTGLTSSSNLTLSSMAVSGAGGASVGLSNGTLVISGATTAAQTVQTANVSAIGNTTGLTSSSVLTLSALTISGAGGLSAGLSAGTLVLSGATVPAQTIQTANLSAVGNTTGQSSSSTASLSSVAFSGAGGLSVGYSAGSIVLSGATTAAQTNQTANFEAIGNTTGSTSLTNYILTNLSLSGAGNVSVGFSGSTVIISATGGGGGQSFTAGVSTNGNTAGTTGTVSNGLVFVASGGITASQSTAAGGATITFVDNETASFYAGGLTLGASSSTTMNQSSIGVNGTNGISVGFSASSLVIQGALASFWEPRPTMSVAQRPIANGRTMAMAPGLLPLALSFDYVRAILSVGAFSLMTSTTSAASTSATASMGQTFSGAIYTAIGSQSQDVFTSLSSATVSFGISQTLSISGVSQSNTVSFVFPNGTVASSFSSSTSTNTTIASSSMVQSTNFSGLMAGDIPFPGMTLGPGNIVFGLQSSSVSAGASAMSWTQNIAMISVVSSGGRLIPGVGLTNMVPGVGAISTAAGIAATFNWYSLTSVPTAQDLAPYIQYQAS